MKGSLSEDVRRSYLSVDLSVVRAARNRHGLATSGGIGGYWLYQPRLQNTLITPPYRLKSIVLSFNGCHECLNRPSLDRFPPFLVDHHWRIGIGRRRCFRVAVNFSSSTLSMPTLHCYLHGTSP